MGVFSPIISYPVVGSLNTFQHTQWEGPVILMLAVISLFLSLTLIKENIWNAQGDFPRARQRLLTLTFDQLPAMSTKGMTGLKIPKTLLRKEVKNPKL